MSVDSNLVRRVGFAVIAIPLALAVVWYGALPLAILLAITATLGARELFDLAARQGIRPVRWFGLVSAAALAPLTYATVISADVRVMVLTAWPYIAALWVIAL